MSCSLPVEFELLSDAAIAAATASAVDSVDPEVAVPIAACCYSSAIS